MEDPMMEEGMRLAHRLVDAVEKQIQVMGFNTAIAKCMEFVNALSRLDRYSKTGFDFRNSSSSSLRSPSS